MPEQSYARTCTYEGMLSFLFISTVWLAQVSKILKSLYKKFGRQNIKDIMEKAKHQV